MRLMGTLKLGNLLSAKYLDKKSNFLSVYLKYPQFDSASGFAGCASRLFLLLKEFVVRKSVGAVVVVAALLGVVFAVVPPVGATAPVIPPGVEPGCGAASGNYAACVTVVNATRGFASPGVVNNASGLAFNARFAQTSRPGGLSGWWALQVPSFWQSEALFAAAGQLEAGLGWVAWRCRIAAPFMHGCRTEVTTQVEQSQNPQVLPANQPMQAEVLRRDPNAVVTASGRVERRTDVTNEMRNCENTSRYVLCRHLGNQGPRDYTRFNFQLTNETVMVNISSTLPNRLNFQWKAVGETILDPRGETPETRLSNGEMNSARSIAPYDPALAAPPLAWWGGLRPLSAENTHIHLAYAIEGTPNVVQIDLQFENVGGVIPNGGTVPTPDRWRPVEDAARACRITGRQAPLCEVSVASVAGNTQLNVALRPFGG